MKLFTSRLPDDAAPDRFASEYINAPLPRTSGRQANFELLRIICMMLILSHHFLDHGGWLTGMTGANAVLGEILQSLFRPSVNLFVLISAYFFCASKNRNIPVKKLTSLWLQVWFYSVLLFTIFRAGGLLPYSEDWVLGAFFPLMHKRYWFFSAYIVMAALSPFLNAMLDSLGKRRHFILCILALLAGSLNGDFHVLDVLSVSAGHNAIWFCCLYVVGAYIRKYDVSFTRQGAALFTVYYIAMVITEYFLDICYSSFITSSAAIYVFLIFKRLNIKNAVLSKRICAVSKLTFGVYLLHDSPELRAYMYQNIFRSAQFYDSEFSFLILMGFIIAAYIMLSACEYLRQMLFRGAGAAASCLKRRIADYVFARRS